MKRVSRLMLSAVLITSISVGLMSCSGGKEKITQEEYNSLKESVTLSNGKTVTELENTMVDFAYKVYYPQKESDIIDGINLIKDITTQAEYNQLVSMAGKFDDTIETSINNVVCRYSLGKYNKDHMDRIYLEFNRTVEGKSRYTALEFVINPNNLIFKHYIWVGPITK